MKIVNIEFGSIFFDKLIELELLLWPENDYLVLYNETKKAKDHFFGAVIDKELVGFIQVSIRCEYINGTSTSPVGFIEGLYVQKDKRFLGIARSLVEYTLKFTKEKGCSEIASDVEINNIASQNFHKKMGFKETERVIFYIKSLDNE